MNNIILDTARETIETELHEASRLTQRLNDDFLQACERIHACSGKVIVSGMGKSGHIGRKIAATLASTGTPAFYVHPAEALCRQSWYAAAVPGRRYYAYGGEDPPGK